MYAAEKYQVLPLIAACLKYLNNSINETDVCTVLEQSIIYGKEKLKKKCMSYIRKHAVDVLRSKAFAGIGEEALKEIVQLNGLNIDELELFRRCIDWARRRTAAAATTAGLRHTLDGILQHIRFPTISESAFNGDVLPLGILTAEEIDEINRLRIEASSTSGTRAGCTSDQPHQQSTTTTTISTVARAATFPYGCLTLHNVYSEQAVPFSYSGQPFHVRINTDRPIRITSLYFVGGDGRSYQTVLHVSNLSLRDARNQKDYWDRWMETGKHYRITYCNDALHAGKTFRVYRLRLGDGEPAVVPPGPCRMSWNFHGNSLDAAGASGSCVGETQSRDGVTFETSASNTNLDAVQFVPLPPDDVFWVSPPYG